MARSAKLGGEGRECSRGCEVKSRRKVRDAETHSNDIADERGPLQRPKPALSHR